jgi:hypothetical protein
VGLDNSQVITCASAVGHSIAGAATMLPHKAERLELGRLLIEVISIHIFRRHNNRTDSLVEALGMHGQSDKIALAGPKGHER